MTLEELLALLPDNTTGAIDAADLRTIVTTLWNNTAALEARLAAVETSAPSTGFSVTGVWQVNPDAGATPQGGQVAADTTSFATATVLRFSRMDRLSQDSAASLLNATSLYAQQKQNSANYVTFDVTDTPTIANNVVTVPVSVSKANGTVGSVAWQETSVVINVATSVFGVTP